MSESLPVYDPDEPARLQETDADCAVESMEWQLYSWGRAPDDNWLEQSMLQAGIWSPAIGLHDASGAQLAAWANAEYGEFGYVASNDPDVSFDAVAAEAAQEQHPLQIGGRGWYHWSAVRGFDGTRLLLANPAPGWQGVDQILSRADWDRLGPWSLVRLCHPAAEGDVEEPPLDYSWWETDGKIGEGLLNLMREDNCQPAQDYSQWYPIGRQPAQIEEAFGENGCRYVWLLTTNVGYRYWPAS